MFDLSVPFRIIPYMSTARVEQNYKVTITIPKAARKALGLKIGDEVETVTHKDGVTLRRKKIKADTATPAERRAILRGRKAYERGETVTLTEVLHELDAPSHQPRSPTPTDW